MDQTSESKFIRIDSTEQLALEEQYHSQSIAKLQKEITEMAEMFGTLNEVVQQQNQPLIIITDQIQSTKVTTENAQVELIQAKQYNVF